MKVAIPVAGPDLDADVDQHFGRCEQFVIVDPETMEFEVVRNTGTHASGGAGITAAELIANQGANVVIAGNMGPNAVRMMGAAGLQFVTGVTGSARAAVEAFAKGELEASSEPTVPGHYGMGGGGGRGMGGGCGGQGMGRHRQPD